MECFNIWSGKSITPSQLQVELCKKNELKKLIHFQPARSGMWAEKENGGCLLANERERGSFGIMACKREWANSKDT
jgi:hypothetical protein